MQTALDVHKFPKVSLLPDAMDVGSIDSNVGVALGIPSIAIGATAGRDAHTLEEGAETASIIPGVKSLGPLAVSLAELANYKTPSLHFNPLVQTALDVHKFLKVSLLPDAMDVGSIDAVAIGIPSIAIGATAGRDAHTLEEGAETTSIIPGVKSLVLLAVTLAELAN